tara:strand:- start:22 stop:171 length:150 start_codon:yes stop_codon:yes gene_type:complete
MERNAKKQINGKINHKILFCFFIAMIKLNIANNEKIYAWTYAKGVPVTG